MKTVDDAAVKEQLQEAFEDLEDARDLARRAGGRGMGLYHACQAAEKYLRAYALAADLVVNVMWSLDRVYAALVALPGLDAVADDVSLLEEFNTPAKGASAAVPVGDALRSAARIRRAVLLGIGVDLSDEPEIEPGSATTDPQPRQAAAPAEVEIPDPEVQPIDPIAAAAAAYAAAADAPTMPQEPSDRPPPRDRYSKGWICATCGVRLPRTRQTSNGRVPCPHCNRPMVPDR
jgi:hypothetical protein